MHLRFPCGEQNVLQRTLILQHPVQFQDGIQKRMLLGDSAVFCEGLPDSLGGYIRVK